MLPLGPPDERRLAVRVVVGVRGLERPPRRSRRARHEPPSSTRSGSANGYWIEDWERAGGSVADQVRFEREWTALRAYARERGIGLIGDVPIYVAQGSVDHLTHPELFLDGLVAGAPPDPLGPLGQHWGNPLFDWDAVAKDGYRWWIERLRRTLALFDLTRIDHFRGFADFWAIPEGEQDARTGRWLPGPREPRLPGRRGGARPAARDRRGSGPDHAGRRSAPRRARLPGDGRDALGRPPDREPDSPHRFENHREHQVIYTTTHDTDTLRGHFPDREPWELIELALSSRPALCMIPAQDVLGLGSEGRMNTPGEPLGNWAWRLEQGQLTAALAERLRAATAATRRVGS